MIRNQFAQRSSTGIVTGRAEGKEGEGNGEREIILMDNNINNSHLLGVINAESTHINALFRKQLMVANSSIKTLEGV
jgi:hypothetical protein